MGRGLGGGDGERVGRGRWREGWEGEMERWGEGWEGEKRRTVTEKSQEGFTADITVVNVSVYC